jgi:anti-anti-sigma factor
MSASPATDGTPTCAVSITSYDDELIVVSLRGEFDASSFGAVGPPVLEAARDAPGLLVADLSALEFMDSSAISLLATLAKLLGDRLRIIPGEAPQIGRIVKLTGVGPVAQELAL